MSAVSKDREMLRKKEEKEHIALDPGAEPAARVSVDAIFGGPPLPRAGIEGGGGSGGAQGMWLRTCAPRALAAERPRQHQLSHIRNCNSALLQVPTPIWTLTVTDTVEQRALQESDRGIYLE